MLLFNAVSAEKESNVTGAPYMFETTTSIEEAVRLNISPPP